MLTGSSESNKGEAETNKDDPIINRYVATIIYSIVFIVLGFVQFTYPLNKVNGLRKGFMVL